MERNLAILFIMSLIHNAWNLPFINNRRVPNELELPMESERDPTRLISLKTETRKGTQDSMYRKPKSPTFQIIVPTNLHVIPLENNVYQIPNANVSRSTHLIPIYSYVPVQYNHWVPIQDLAVIPLNKQQKVQSREVDDDEVVNSYLRLFGGYGPGRYYGGHGHGHGFAVNYLYG